MQRLQAIMGPVLGEGQQSGEVDSQVVALLTDADAEMKDLHGEGSASKGDDAVVLVAMGPSAPKAHHELIEEELRLASEMAEQRMIARMKKISLVLLTLQNCVVIVALKYSRTRAAKDSDGRLYITTTAVALGEVVKFIISVWIIVWGGGLKGLGEDVKTEMIDKPIECAKMIVPSLLYTVQNNLMYAAMYHISAAAFQCTMQLKILTTAFFSVVLLGKHLELHRWGGLAVLMLGCIFVNLDQSSGSPQPPSALEGGGAQYPLLGVAMTVTAACTSGLAGVYFEKLLKGAKTSLWIRQIQLSLGGMGIGFACVALQVPPLPPPKKRPGGRRGRFVTTPPSARRTGMRCRSTASCKDTPFSRGSSFCGPRSGGSSSPP